MAEPTSTSASPTEASRRVDDGVVRDGFDVARRLLTAVAVLAVIGTVLALLLVHRLGQTYQVALQVTSDSASVGSASVEEAIGLVDEVDALAVAVAQTLDQVESVLDSTAQSLDQIGAAMADNVADSIEGTAEIANGLAGLIEAIERFIPGDSDSLAESLRKISDGLEPAPDQLRALAVQLDANATELRLAARSLSPIQTSVENLAVGLSDSQDTLRNVEQLAADIAERADAALDRANRDIWLLRLLVVVLGIGTIAVCLAGRRALGGLARGRVAPVDV